MAYIVTVCSKFGAVIDNFQAYSKKEEEYLLLAIAPNGDVYFKTIKPINNAFPISRIRNTWDPIDPPAVINSQLDVPTVTSLTATSYITYAKDYYLYHPIKAFDGNIKTSWLESVKGPGIGETITLELDKEITADSIQVLPGLFDDKWWKANNRVKTLLMKIGDDITTLQFQDVMKPQQATFKQPKTFKKVEFIIKEVYPSGKDDDTAISEIQFYYKGKNIKLDLGKQEKYLKKVTTKTEG